MTLRRFAFMLAACLAFAGKANDMVDTVGRRSNMIQDYYLTQFRLKAAERRARLDNVRAKADAEIQDAVKAKEEAEVMKAEYEKNMQEAKEKANDIVLTAQKTAAVQSEEMLKEASSQVTAMKEKAEKDIAQERRKAVNGIKGEIGGMAVEIAGKVIEREINEEDHTKLINDFIENVGEAS